MFPSVPELLADQLEQRCNVLLSMTEGWSASQASVRLHPNGPSGWTTLQHLIEMTGTLLAALGLPIPATPSPADWFELRAQFAEVAQELSSAVLAQSPESLQTKPAIEVLPEFERTLTSRLAFLQGHIFHLGYHAGQLGSLAALVKRGANQGL